MAGTGCVAKPAGQKEIVWLAALFLLPVALAAFLAFTGRNTAPKTTLSDNEIIGRDTTGYVFTDPNVVARRAQSARDTEKFHKKSCESDPKGHDCRISTEMLRNNARWGIPPGGQIISG